MYMKICSKCEIEKELTEFYKRSDNLDGYRNICKKCHAIKIPKKEKTICESGTKECDKCFITKEFSEFYKRDNLDGYRNTCKICWNKIIEEKRIKNPEYSINYGQKYRKEHKEYSNAYSRRYRIEHKGYDLNYRKNRKKIDLLFKIKEGIRQTISGSFRRNSFKKTSKTAIILGCSYEEFKKYIESKFETWMNWDNKGLYNGKLDYGWDIDHIIPISEAKTEEELVILNHYSNLQPLCSKINRDIKKDKLNYIK